MMTEEATGPKSPAKKAGSGWLNVLIDYGPLLVFFLVYKFYSRDGAEIMAVVRGTGAFIAASIVALAASKWRFGKVSPMLWLSTILIVGFGGLTIYTGSEWWIQRKPTVIYALFAVALLGGYAMGKALLKWLLETAFDGLSDTGWMKLSRNWGVFFIFLAVLNEVLAHMLSFDGWLAAKLWVFMPLSFLFTFAQLPMLMKHGLSVEGAKEEETNLPPA